VYDADANRLKLINGIDSLTNKINTIEVYDVNIQSFRTYGSNFYVKEYSGDWKQINVANPKRIEYPRSSQLLLSCDPQE
jgi:hypothetical protein